MQGGAFGANAPLSDKTIKGRAIVSNKTVTLNDTLLLYSSHIFNMYSSLNEYVATNRNDCSPLINFLGYFHTLSALHVFTIQ